MIQKDTQVVEVTDTAPVPVLSEEPFIRIRPGRSRIAPNLKRVWMHRELLYFLIWRDLKVQYKETFLGAAWVMMQPLLMAIVFTIFMSQLIHIPSNGVPYPVFAYAGILSWLFFSTAIQSTSYSLIANSYILTKVHLPRLIVPMAMAGVKLADFLVASLMLLVLMLYYGMPLRWSILMWPVLTFQLALLVLGIGIWASAFNARYRDFGALMTVLLQIWMFASPIIYPAQLVPEHWRLVYSINPVAGIVEGIRSSLFGLAFDWNAIGISAVVTVCILPAAIRSFFRMDDNIVDIL